MSTIEVLDAYAALRREIALLSAAELKSSDYGPKQLSVLYRLTISPATMGELSLFMASDKAATTRVVAALEDSGWVKRVGHETDKRVTIIHLTAKGQTLAKSTLVVRTAIGERINRTLTGSERKELAKLLNKVVVGLQDQRK
jgi:DNA-binding MarR family transcriptional regulator